MNSKIRSLFTIWAVIAFASTTSKSSKNDSTKKITLQVIKLLIYSQISSWCTGGQLMHRLGFMFRVRIRLRSRCMHRRRRMLRCKLRWRWWLMHGPIFMRWRLLRLRLRFMHRSKLLWRRLLRLRHRYIFTYEIYSSHHQMIYINFSVNQMKWFNFARAGTCTAPGSCTTPTGSTPSTGSCPGSLLDSILCNLRNILGI